MRSLSRRQFLSYGAAAAASALVVGACGSSSKTSSNSNSGTAVQGGKKDGDTYSFNLWSYDNPPGVKQLKQMATAYNATATAKVKFNISTLAGSGATLYPSKIQSLISSGNSPDLFLNWVGTLAEPFVTEGAVQSLASWYDKYSWDKILAPAAVRYVTFKGEPYEVPLALDTLSVWYNKSLFAKAGAKVPTTYAEWETANDALAKSGTYPAIEAMIDGWDIMRLFEHLLEMTAGPALHDKLLTLDESWDNPAVANAFDLLKEWGDKWLEKGYAGVNPNDANVLFTGGKGAQSFQGPWEVANLQAASANLDDFSMFVPPIDTTAKPRLGGFAQGYQIGSHVKGAALDALGGFFNWVVQPANSRKYFYDGGTATVGGVPTGQPLATLAAQIQSTHDAYLIQDEALGTALANSYFSIQSNVCNGSTSPKAAATAMQAAVAKRGKS
jgi:raffinose/stachyose/melibiose transport system substrate-binding protein